MASWLIKALILGLLAVTLPLAVRALYGPPGAFVNIRWQPSVDAAERQRLEMEWQLVDGQEVGPSTWRYDLTAPSERRLRAMVQHAAVADTHNIDRQRYTLAPETHRTIRRHGLVTVGGTVAVRLMDRLSLLLAMLAGLYVLVRPSPGPTARTVSPTVSPLSVAPRTRRWGVVALLLAPAVCLFAFATVVARMLGPGTDFDPHIEFARQLAETGAMLPHFGYHAMVVVVQALTPADWVAAAEVVTLGGVAACAAIVAWWLRGALSTSASALVVAAALVPAAVLVLQPVLPFDPSRYDAWLFGYFPPNQWHSPTTLFSKPFALLLLGLGPAVVWPAYGTRAGWTRMLASAALVVMSIVVKPNFIMAFLPAMGVLAVLNWRRADWFWLGLGFALPAVAVLEWQYAVTYAANTEGVGIILAPLHVIRLHVSAGLATLGWRLAASVLFPLAAVACFPSVRADRRVQLPWLRSRAFRPCAPTVVCNSVGPHFLSGRPSAICWPKVTAPAPETSCGLVNWRPSCCSPRRRWR